MLFLFDAISTSMQYTHYKLFEVDTDVYYAYTKTKWKSATPPNDFYLTKLKGMWQTNIEVSELVLTDISIQLEAYLKNRTLEAKGSEKPGWLYEQK